ncbi:hypothetical protein BC567DRAFT_64741 [Phyllosticta citribraziliensis]
MVREANKENGSRDAPRVALSPVSACHAEEMPACLPACLLANNPYACIMGCLDVCTEYERVYACLQCMYHASPRPSLARARRRPAEHDYLLACRSARREKCPTFASLLPASCLLRTRPSAPASPWCSRSNEWFGGEAVATARERVSESTCSQRSNHQSRRRAQMGYW